jgi:hypothetical protein
MKYISLKTALLLILLLSSIQLEATSTNTGGKTPEFKKSLNLEGLHFLIDESGDGSLRKLKLTVKGIEGGKDIVLKEEIDGGIYRTAVADLNGDGFPEIYLFTTSAGSGSYGAVIAYGSNKNKSVTPIYMPELDLNSPAAEGYMGHDEFTVDKNRLLRSFPVYKKEDPNCCPSGGTRQLSYRLIKGEASWKLELDKITNLKKNEKYDHHSDQKQTGGQLPKESL